MFSPQRNSSMTSLQMRSDYLSFKITSAESTLMNGWNLMETSRKEWRVSKGKKSRSGNKHTLIIPCCNSTEFKCPERLNSAYKISGFGNRRLQESQRLSDCSQRTSAKTAALLSHGFKKQSVKLCTHDPELPGPWWIFHCSSAPLSCSLTSGWPREPVIAETVTRLHVNRPRRIRTV